MPDLNLDEIKRRCEKATPGPWHDRAGNRIVCQYPETGELDSIPATVADSHFIAHARTDIPALVAEVERLRKENERLRASQEAHNKELADQEREFQREAREIAAEERWKMQQGDEYGSY